MVGSLGPLTLRTLGDRKGRVALDRRGIGSEAGSRGRAEAWLVFAPEVFDGLQDLRPGIRSSSSRGSTVLDEMSDDVATPEHGVFSTRLADRPNPIGLHPVEIRSVDGLRVRVRSLEAVDGTPITDVKPVLRKGDA